MRKKMMVKEQNVAYQTQTPDFISQEEKEEMEMNLKIHRLMSYRTKLKEILERYHVKDPERIDKMIELHQIEEHPSYEDYLEAITYQMWIRDIQKELMKRLVKIK